jgi:hypothetical protein
VILSRDSKKFTGGFHIDDVLLRSEGVKDFKRYRIDAEQDLWSDYFIPDDTPQIEPMEFPDIPQNYGKVAHKNTMS